MSKLLTVPQVADRLSVSKKTVYRLARRGEIPVVRIGSAIRFDADMLQRFIHDQLGPAQEKQG